MSRKSAAIILGVVLMISAALRLYQLDAGLWLDEITTYMRYARLPFGEIVQSFESENQHFLYSILAHASFVMFGEGNWELRLPAVIFGVASILVIFLLGLELMDPLQALLSSSLLAFSYHHVWFSQNARGYIFLLFFTLLSSWLLLRAIKKNNIILWLLYAISAALGVYSHLTMVFVIIGQFAAFLFSYFKNKDRGSKYLWRSILAGFVACGLMVLLLHAPVLGEMRTVIGGTQVSDVEAWKSPLWTLKELINGLEIGFSGFSVGLIAIAVFMIGLFSFWKSSPEFIILFVVPPILGAATTIVIGHHLWPRFFFFAMGFGAIVVIRGVFAAIQMISKFFRLSARQATAISTTLCIAMIGISALSIPRAYGPKQDFDGALKFLQEQRAPGDKIVTIYISDIIYNEFYRTNWDAIQSTRDLQEIEQNTDRIWIVYAFPDVLKAKYPDIYEYIQQNYEFVREFDGTVSGGEIVIYRRSSGTGQGNLAVNSWKVHF